MEFTNAREAKESLVARIAEEAQRDGVSLSDVERKMLYFSETGWTLPEIFEVNREFDLDYHQAGYERKIATLIGNARNRARKEDRALSDDWSATSKLLSREDHYLTVMIRLADTVVRPHRDLWKLWGTGLAICLAFLAFLMFGSHC
jgi:hypothetical protein